MPTVTEKKDMEAERANFLVKKKELSDRIDSLKSLVYHSKEEVERLMREIDRSRPILDDCQAICPKCDVVSLKFQRTETDPESPGAYWWALQHYACVLCGEEKIIRDYSAQPRPYSPPISYDIRF